MDSLEFTIIGVRPVWKISRSRGGVDEKSENLVFDDIGHPPLVDPWKLWRVRFQRGVWLI